MSLSVPNPVPVNALNNDLDVLNVYDPEQSIFIKKSSELYHTLEKVLYGYVDSVLKSALFGLSMYEYVFIGGKSFSAYLKSETPKLFDFNMHMLKVPRRAEDIYKDLKYWNLDAFATDLANEMNRFVSESFPLFRTYLYKILERIKLVSEHEQLYYHNPIVPLFHYGLRLIKINGLEYQLPGIYIRLILRDGLFPYSYSNIIYPSSEYYRDKNELCYPISNIIYEQSLNWNTNITPSSGLFISQKYDNIRYCHYIASIFYSIKYLEEGINIDNNYVNLLRFQDFKNYTCQFISNYDDHNIHNALCSLNFYAPDVLKKSLSLEPLFHQNPEYIKYQLYDHIHKKFIPLFGDTKLKYIMNTYYTNYKIQRHYFYDQCVSSILLHYGKPNKNNIYKMALDETTLKSYLTIVENIANHYDNLHQRKIYWYTTNGYNIINDFLELYYHGIGSVTQYDKLLSGIEMLDEIVTLSDGSTIIFNVNVPESTLYLNIINEVSAGIKEINQEYSRMNMLDILHDEFYVYRVQNFMIVGSESSDYFNPSILQKGSVFVLPKFVSTSYHTGYSYVNFLKMNSFIMRIKINKYGNYWMFLNNYSAYQDEHEVLLDRNLYYYVENVSTMPIFYQRDGKDMMYDVTVIDIVPYRNQTELMESISRKSISTVHLHGFDVRLEYGGQEPTQDRDIPKSQQTIKMMNTLFFDNTKSKFDVDFNESILDDTSKYHHLLKMIDESPKSSAYRILNRKYGISYTMDQMVMPKSKKWKRDIKPVPPKIDLGHMMATQAGGNHFLKY